MRSPIGAVLQRHPWANYLHKLFFITVPGMPEARMFTTHSINVCVVATMRAVWSCDETCNGIASDPRYLSIAGDEME